MIYVNKISGPQLLHLPLTEGPANLGEGAVLVLNGTTSLNMFRVDIASWSCGQLYMTVTADFGRVTAGEYEYRLDGVSSGLLKVLDQAGLTQYAQSIVYEQYNPIETEEEAGE